MQRYLTFLRWVAAALFGAFTAGILALAALYVYLAPQLPSIDHLRDVRLQVPLRIFTHEGALIAEFGEKRRTPVHIEEVPDSMIQAFLAAEDDRFYEHPGVDYQGLLRAAAHLIRTGEKGQGGSTITMQVARNFFLSAEKTYIRKISEILLSLKIERDLSKNEILELYLNKIYLGNRAYGVAAAAQAYYGVNIKDLTLPQVAMIAGLPKAPSRYNPIADPERALTRRNYVLRRMHELGYIGDAEYKQAVATADNSAPHGLAIAVEAPYVAEMVRSKLAEDYGADIYTEGLRVITTIDGLRQQAANAALRQALLDYDQRHGYRGPERHVELEQFPAAVDRDRLLADFPPVADLQAALVLEVAEKEARIYLRGGEIAHIHWDGLSWARRYINDNYRGPAPGDAGEILQAGDVIRVHAQPDGAWRLTQVPAVEGALVALSPQDGAIQALVGGFDFYQSKFNRAVQAQRQPGSSFKPFIYSAALEKGFTPATAVNDAPVVFEDNALEATWRPENYSGRFYGPTRLREALVNSRNLVSIRVLQAIGIDYAIDYASRFGFRQDALPRDLSLALGSAAASPLDMASAYAIFANGGFRIAPYFIQRIEDADGTIIYQATPEIACPDCEAPDAAADTRAPADQAADQPAARADRVITPQNVYLMTSMMRDVVRRGTARRAMQLGRHDLSGKTGTTNDQRDAWFCGFNGNLVATTWVGFDQVHPLGRGETGGHAALPMWMSFMSEALAGTPETPLKQPPGLVTARIDPKSGLLASADQPNAIFETFFAGSAPTQTAEPNGTASNGETTGLPEQLF